MKREVKKTLESLSLGEKKEARRYLGLLIRKEGRATTTSWHSFPAALQVREEEYLTWKAEQLNKRVKDLVQRERDFQNFVAVRAGMRPNNVGKYISGQETKLSLKTFKQLVAALELESELDRIFSAKPISSLSSRCDFSSDLQRFTPHYEKRWTKRFNRILKIYPNVTKVLERLLEYQNKIGEKVLTSHPAMTAFFQEGKNPSINAIGLFIRTFEEDPDVIEMLGHKPVASDFLVYRG